MSALEFHPLADIFPLSVGMGGVGKRGGDGRMKFHRRHGDGEHEGGKNGPFFR